MYINFLFFSNFNYNFLSFYFSYIFFTFLYIDLHIFYLPWARSNLKSNSHLSGPLYVRFEWKDLSYIHRPWQRLSPSKLKSFYFKIEIDKFYSLVWNNELINKDVFHKRNEQCPWGQTFRHRKIKNKYVK